jgi:hypothetical protein
MKLKLLLIALVLCCTCVFSQTKNNISLVYGFNANSVDIHGAVGDYGYKYKTGQSYGLNYTRSFSELFSIETGLLYSKNKVELMTIGPAGGLYYGEIRMLSVPALAKFTFLKYLYAEGGVVLDHQINYKSDGIADSQSGVGLEIGVGGKYNLGPVSVFINPYYTDHRFYGKNNLIDTGVTFGLGYNF